jgi:isopropylmalate/homocitrate/citramalate synthase
VLYGQEIDLNYDKLRPYSQLVREISGIQVPSNRPIVGDTIFDMEAGIITDWYKNVGEDHFLEVFPFVPELVGHEREQIILGKKSGRASIDIWLDRIEVDVDNEERAEILQRVKVKGIERKGPITELDFRAIVDEVTAS